MSPRHRRLPTHIKPVARRGALIGYVSFCASPPRENSRLFQPAVLRHQNSSYFSLMVMLWITSPVKVGFWDGSRSVIPLTTSIPLITWPNIV